jgi:hypothetical protein
MYCPQCAIQNIEGAKFCRACGADIRLVSQALKGSLHANSKGVWMDESERRSVEERAADIERERKRRPHARVDEGVRDIFKGIGFLCVFIVGMLAFRGAFWWTIWFIIPAFKHIGEGVAEIVRARQQAQLTATHAPQVFGEAQPAPLLSDAPRLNQFSTHDTAEMIQAPPASVTEMTTRHLDAPPRERRLKDA